jgi:hypothetical protein
MRVARCRHVEQARSVCGTWGERHRGPELVGRWLIATSPHEEHYEDAHDQ